MQVKSIAECSLRSLFCLLLSDRFIQVLLYQDCLELSGILATVNSYFVKNHLSPIIALN